MSNQNAAIVTLLLQFCIPSALFVHVQGRTDGAKLPIKNFCFDDYRYVSSVLL